MTSTDEQHLKMLSIAHYIVGGLHFAMAVVPLLGAIAIASAMGAEFGEFVAEAPIVPVVMVFVLIILALAPVYAVMLLLSGRAIARRSQYRFTFVMACISCMFPPTGTIIGVATIVVLSRPSVKTAFAEQRRREKFPQVRNLEEQWQHHR